MTTYPNSLLIVGVVRNCAHCIVGEVKRLSAVTKTIPRVYFFLVESDSSDDTVERLNLLRDSDPNFTFEVLGRLQDAFPHRTDRIAYCRNKYLQKIRATDLYRKCDYVLVADFDGVNSKLTASAFASCWARKDWDVCTANQAGPYYDIWALRHDSWSPNDYEEAKSFLRSYGVSRYRAQVATVLARMIVIPTGSPWIRVNSAFGGLALYKTSAILNKTYEGLLPSGAPICEHVTLNQKITENGGKIYINPGLVNCCTVHHAREVSGFAHAFLWLISSIADLRDSVARRLKSVLLALAHLHSCKF